jgi:hypothetical protein
MPPLGRQNDIASSRLDKGRRGDGKDECGKVKLHDNVQSPRRSCEWVFEHLPEDERGVHTDLPCSVKCEAGSLLNMVSAMGQLLQFDAPLLSSARKALREA